MTGTLHVAGALAPAFAAVDAEVAAFARLEAGSGSQWSCGGTFANTGFRASVQNRGGSGAVAALSTRPFDMLLSAPAFVPENGVVSVPLAEADRILVPLLLQFDPGPSDRGARAAVESRRAEAFFRAAVGHLKAALPAFAERPRDHVFFLFGDRCGRVLDCFGGSRVFNVSAVKGDGSLPLPYRSDLNPELLTKPIEARGHDLAFQGCGRTHGLRLALRDALAAGAPDGWRVEVVWKDLFFNMYPALRRQDLRRGFARLLADTAFMLCPRGAGPNSVRFYETLAFGRIPVLISDEARLPLEGLIPYDDFVVRVPETDLGSLFERLDAFRSRTSLEQASTAARAAFDTYFRDERFGAFLGASLAADAVRKGLPCAVA